MPYFRTSRCDALTLILLYTCQSGTSLAAAVFLKNVVKKRWVLAARRGAMGNVRAALLTALLTSRDDNRLRKLLAATIELVLASDPSPAKVCSAFI